MVVVSEKIPIVACRHIATGPGHYRLDGSGSTRAEGGRPRKMGMRRPQFREMAPMQPCTPRSYALAAPASDYLGKTLAAWISAPDPPAVPVATTARCAHSIWLREDPEYDAAGARAGAGLPTPVRARSESG